jgi:type I restriction enzyme M protein
MSTEASIVIKKIVPYLQRRGYSLDDNLFFGERAKREQERAGFVDILIKRSQRSPKALFLIEAKRDTARLNAKHRDQALEYGRSLKVPFVVTTNGSDVELYNVESGTKLKFNGSVIGKIPHYTNLDKALDQLKANPLTDNITFNSDESLPFRPGLSLPELLALIRRCHNTIRDVEKDEEEIFSDFSKLLFLKLLEEKDDRHELDFKLPYSYRFYELAQRKDEPDQVKDAILSMMSKVVGLREYGDVMTAHLRMNKPATFLKVVSELAKASFSDSELDVRGSVFEYFVKTSLKGKKLGQFFTPRQLVRFMLSLIPLEQILADLIDPQYTVKVIDPACGSGGFLLAGMNHLLHKVETEKEKGAYSKERADRLKLRIRKDVFFGAEANKAVASTAKMNMIIAGDGFANIKPGDSLSEDVPFLRIGKNAEPQATFTISNPPFGMSEAKSLAVEDLELYDVQLTKTQALFLQKMVRITKAGGKICTVIDEGLLNTANTSRIRKYIADNCFVDAVISLPDVTFKPNKINVKCAVLLLTKKASDDEAQEHPIRMLEMATLGYNAQGEEAGEVPIEEIIKLVKARWKDMARLTLSLEDTGDIFRSYPLNLSDVLAEEDVRLDFKYYDPTTLALIEELKSKGAVSLKELATEPLKRGNSPAKAEYNTDGESEAIVIKAGNIGRVGIVGEFDTILTEVYDRLKSAQIKQNDLLLASTGDGTLGKAAVYHGKQNAIADSHVTIIRLNKRRLDPEYVAWYLRSEYGQAQINRLFTGATGLIELPVDKAERIFILAPTSIEEQRGIAREWAAQIKVAQDLEAQAQKKREQAQRAFIAALNGALDSAKLF